MHVQQEEDEDEDAENGENEEKKKDNPGVVIGCKVVVTRESGLQASEPTRWGRQRTRGLAGCYIKSFHMFLSFAEVKTEKLLVSVSVYCVCLQQSLDSISVVALANRS